MFAVGLPSVAHAARWYDLREDLAIVRWHLHRQEPAGPAAHRVEGHIQAARERLGVIAGSLFRHDDGSSLSPVPAYLGNDTLAWLVP
jgi:hypothetical protein